MNSVLHVARRFQRSASKFWNAVLHAARRSELDRNRERNRDDAQISVLGAARLLMFVT